MSLSLLTRVPSRSYHTAESLHEQLSRVCAHVHSPAGTPWQVEHLRAYDVDVELNYAAGEGLLLVVLDDAGDARHECALPAAEVSVDAAERAVVLLLQHAVLNTTYRRAVIAAYMAGQRPTDAVALVPDPAASAGDADEADGPFSVTARRAATLLVGAA